MVQCFLSSPTQTKPKASLFLPSYIRCFRFVKATAGFPGKGSAVPSETINVIYFNRCFQMMSVSIYSNSEPPWQWMRWPFCPTFQLWILWTVYNFANWVEKRKSLTSDYLPSCFPDYSEARLLFRCSGHLYFLFCRSPIYIHRPFLYWDFIFSYQISSIHQRGNKPP